MYYIIPNWDKILHFLSGFLASHIGIETYKKCDGEEKNKKLIYSFSFLFAASMAVLWEIYEFSVDAIIGTNAQNDSLSDTMLDMIAGTVSSVIYILFIYLKKRKSS